MFISCDFKVNVKQRPYEARNFRLLMELTQRNAGQIWDDRWESSIPGYRSAEAIFRKITRPKAVGDS